MIRLISALVCLCLMLTGCSSWLDGNYVSVKPHEEKLTEVSSENANASNYYELRTVLENMVSAGMEKMVINVAKYNQEMLPAGVEMAVNYLQELYPVGAYAIETIDCEIGTVGGAPAVSASVQYIHGRSELRKIETVKDVDEAREKIVDALVNCEDSLVLLVRQYERFDVVQLVEDCAMMQPNLVMETPEIAVGVYPDMGVPRVLEIKFTYQTSRDVLRHMQAQVRSIFSSAELYIGDDISDYQKYNQLYSFLMERFDYEIKTSITPAYSLLYHGVGDAKTFASVYGAICRRVGLDCQVVSGTRMGEPWYWNMVEDDGTYYHVDLLSCVEAGGFREMREEEMEGYVWDYSSYHPEDPTRPYEN